MATVPGSTVPRPRPRPPVRHVAEREVDLDSLPPVRRALVLALVAAERAKRARDGAV